MPGDDPLFSVIVSTYNRGRHIVPTIVSALEQSVRDFELIIVTDGCTDDTAEVARSFASAKVRTFELPLNSGSQSAPNNAGLERARGRYIAYLGHDDVWHPDHLARAAAAFAADPTPDAVVGGCIYHGPPGSGIVFVAGLLDDEHTAVEHFVPPSALAHTRALAERIGPWARPESIAAPVDADFVLRAVHAGARFTSTGTITVHKFAAGHRYLSYLTPQSREQAAVLRALQGAGRNDDSSFVLAAARRQGRFMAMKHVDWTPLGEGGAYRRNRSNKGLEVSPLRALDRRTTIPQTGESRGLDWHELEGGEHPYRWSGPSRTAHLLIPFTGTCAADLALDVANGTPVEVLEAMSFASGGTPLAHTVRVSERGYTIELEVTLSHETYLVLELNTPVMFRPDECGESGDTRRLGVALGDVTVTPRRRRRWLEGLDDAIARTVVPQPPV